MCKDIYLYLDKAINQVKSKLGEAKGCSEKKICRIDAVVVHIIALLSYNMTYMFHVLIQKNENSSTKCFSVVKMEQ